MKVILYATRDETTRRLMQEIKTADHWIVATVDEPNQLLQEIARTTPHKLVVQASPKSEIWSLIRGRVRNLFPELQVYLLAGDLADSPEAWGYSLQEFLALAIKPPTPRPYATGDRVVCHDESLTAFWKGKLNRPEQEEGWEKVCSHQEARFILQLQTGRKNHPAAKRYFDCLIAQQTGLDQELAYRLPHGSYKALSWSRDLAVKWLALLAHYIPDAELDYLPIPGTPGPAIDFVHHETPLEGIYAATLIICSKVKPTIENAIKEVVTARFDRQDGDALLALSLKIYGTAKFLEQVGKAQIELMDAWLDPAFVERAEGSNVPRGEHRNAGIFRDFYDLTFIVNSPEPLASILRGFHNGNTYVEERQFLPSFAEFRRLSHATGAMASEQKTELS